ncbi:GDSL esterase/lipase [Camellia lanceoleosa]|nr:GDSL esterase/lipase [Camellia lanceoleosa]
MGALTPMFLFLLFLSANSDESSKLDSSCFSAIPISNLVAALYVFGDSTVDAGNKNYILKAARANYLPYGIDFNNTPIGRFTNGKTIADFIGIILLTTVNCTLPLVWFGFVLFSLTVQEDLPCMIEDPQELAEYLANSIFFISMGANDYILNFNNHHDPEYFANSLLIQFRWYLQCDEQMNQNIMPYNSQLPQTLKNIQDEYPDATLSLANSHDLLQDILADTKKYRFTDVKDPCCRAYVDGKLDCFPNSTPCDNRCQYLFLDASHTSEFANCIFVRDMLVKD